MDYNMYQGLLEPTMATINRLVAKFKRSLDGGEWKDEFSDEEAVKLSKDISSLCPLYGHKLYLFYEQLYGTYYKQNVLPCVKKKQGEEMLRELCHRWNNHKKMVSYLAKIFGGLQKFVAELSFTSDEVCLASHILSNRKRAGKYKASLEEVAMVTFRDQVLLVIASEATTALIKMITDQRDGVEIDQTLPSRVCDLFVLCGLGSEEVYEMNFERYFLDDTQSYYSTQASSWIADDSFLDYLLKVEKSLKNEKERVAPYLHSSTEPKLVDVVHEALLVSVQDQLLEKENSGFRSCLSKDQKDNLSMIFRVYRAFPKRLKAFAKFFKLHITEEMNSLIEQAEHGLNSVGSVNDEALFREIADLHDKYMEYVRDCFHYRARFFKAFKKAFATLGGSLIAERLATFCHNEPGVNDLSNLYKICDTASLSLVPVADAFKRHVTAQVEACIQKAKDALSSGGSVKDEVLVREIGGLHDKYMEFGRDYFQDDPLFHCAFKEAFAICCKMTLGGSSIAEQLATFCKSKAGVNYLPKVYKIYVTASLSLEPVVDAFELHVTARVKACIQEEAKDAEALVKEIIKLLSSLQEEEFEMKYLQAVIQRLRDVLEQETQGDELVNSVLSTCITKCGRCLEDLLACVESAEQKSKERKKYRTFDSLKLTAENVILQSQAVELVSLVATQRKEELLNEETRSVLEKSLENISDGFANNSFCPQEDLFGLMFDFLGHGLAGFALDLLIKRLKKKDKMEELFNQEELLDPFVPLVIGFLSNTQHVSSALSVLDLLMSKNLPSLTPQGDSYDEGESKVLDLAMNSENEEIRSIGKKILLDFLRKDSIHDDQRFLKHAEYLLEKPRSDRAIDLLSAIFGVLVETGRKQFLNKHVKEFFGSLLSLMPSQVDNEPSPTGDLITWLVKNVDRQHAGPLVVKCLDSFEECPAAVSKLMVFFMETFKRNIDKHFETLWKKMETAESDFHKYCSLVMLDKVLAAFPQFLLRDDSEDMWTMVFGFLVQPDARLKNIRVRLLERFSDAFEKGTSENIQEGLKKLKRQVERMIRRDKEEIDGQSKKRKVFYS